MGDPFHVDHRRRLACCPGSSPALAGLTPIILIPAEHVIPRCCGFTMNCEDVILRGSANSTSVRSEIRILVRNGDAPCMAPRRSLTRPSRIELALKLG